MSKPSALVDKSLFHELCKIQDATTLEDLWHKLHEKYQLVMPLVLIEETVVNAVTPGTKPLDEIQQLIREVAAHSSCWLEDMYEIAFRELVECKPLTTLPPLADPMASEIFRLRLDDESLKAWVTQRRKDTREAHNRWRTEQQRLVASAYRTELRSEAQLFNVVRSEFLRRLNDPQQRKDMLEHILGVVFRRRHRESPIDEAFAQFTPDTFTQFYVTLTCINCRLAFFLAPTFMLPGASPKEKLRFLKQAPNNLYDAEYVSSALICERFLTRDEGQARMCRVFKQAGYWKGEVVFVPPKDKISTALPAVLV